LWYIPKEETASESSAREEHRKRKGHNIILSTKDIRMAKVTKNIDDMRSEYDFSHAERGKYADRMRSGSNVVVIDPELADLFPDSESVNEALRAVADMARLTSGRKAA